MNPRLVWCFMGEDMMGKCRGIRMASAKGVPPWQVSQKALFRYEAGFDLDF